MARTFIRECDGCARTCRIGERCIAVGRPFVRVRRSALRYGHGRVHRGSGRGIGRYVRLDVKAFLHSGKHDEVQERAYGVAACRTFIAQFELMASLIHDHAVVVVAISGTNQHERRRARRLILYNVCLLRIDLQHPCGVSPSTSSGRHVNLLGTIVMSAERIADELHDRVGSGTSDLVIIVLLAILGSARVFVANQHSVRRQEEHGSVIHALVGSVAFKV